MPKTKEQFQEQREQTRERLLQTALRLFATVGYAETTIGRIAQEAGVAQGLLYHYFPGKNALLQAIFAESLAQVQESFAAGALPGTAEERLERLLRRSFEIVRENLHFWRLTYALRFQPSALESFQPSLHAWTATVLTTLEHHLHNIGYPNPKAEAVLLFATVDGIAQHYALQPDNYPLATTIDALVSRYCLLSTRKTEENNATNHTDRTAELA